MRTVILVTCAALALAACGKTPPPRRAGLWRETIVRTGGSGNLGPMNSIKVCTDTARDAKSAVFNHDAAAQQAKAHHCTSSAASRGLDGVYRFSSTCPVPGGNGTIDTKGTASGDFTQSYHLRIQADITRPAPFAGLNSHQVDDIDGAWLGPCPAGMAPGDMMLANGQMAPGGRMASPHREAH